MFKQSLNKLLWLICFILSVGLVWTWFYAPYRDAPATAAVPLTKTMDLGEGVTFLTAKTPCGVVRYSDGTELPADSPFACVITLEDYRAKKERLAGKPDSVKDTDFPVVVFLNSTLFDMSGKPSVVRRARDGHKLWRAADLLGLVTAITPLRDGSFKVVLAYGEEKTLSEEEWIKGCVRLPDQEIFIPPEALARMTDEELKKYGYEKAKQPAAKPPVP